jgi:hypothetical protein
VKQSWGQGSLSKLWLEWRWGRQLSLAWPNVSMDSNGRSWGNLSFVHLEQIFGSFHAAFCDPIGCRVLVPIIAKNTRCVLSYCDLFVFIVDLFNLGIP